ncbi:hypothetical protein BD770DRAFT_449517 [Pilaira anomala]|nr:hypothetical protein BD770DRAFT_449517 [Pilaira anomala]
MAEKSAEAKNTATTTTTTEEEVAKKAADARKKAAAIYKLSEVQALWYLADAWQRVKVSTIKNCWDHTNILQFKHRRDSSIETDITDDDFVLPPDEGLPLDDDIVRKIVQLIPELPLNDGQVVESYELDLEADESDLVVTEPYGAAATIEEEEEEEVEEEEEEEEENEEIQVAGYKAKRNNLKRALELILLNTTPGVDNDEDLFICASKKLKSIKEEETSEKKQTTLLQFFTPPNSL